MNKLFLICAFLAVFSFSATAVDVSNCPLNIVNRTAFFNLCPFARADRFIDVTYKQGDYDFTLRATLGKAHAASCAAADVSVWATINSGQCFDLAVDNPSLAFIDQNNENSGLRIAFPQNGKQGAYPKKLVVDLVCNKSMPTDAQAVFEVSSIDENDKIIYLSGSSFYGCPYFTLPQLFNFLEANKYIFVAAAAVLGLFFSFFGLQLFNITVFLITTVSVTLISGILFFEFVKFGTQQWVLWVIFGTCVTVGAIAGYLAVKYEKVGFFALGSYLGVIGGLLLYNAVLIHFLNDGQNALFYVIIVACGLIGGGIALWLWQSVIIIATSVIGAYMFVRALSVLIGGFPNEIAVVNGAEQLNGYAYLYLLGIVMKAFLGMYFQFRQKRAKEEAKEEEDQFKAYKRV